MDQATSSQKNTSKMVFQVVVDIHGGQTLLIDLCDTEEQFKTITVLQLKEKICEHTGWSARSRIELSAPEADTARQFAHKTAQKMGKIYQVVVIGLRMEKIVIDLCDTEEQFKTITVLQLKEKILSKLPSNIGPDDLRLIFTYKNLEGDSTLLCEYGIQHMSTIQALLWMGGGGFPEKGDGGMGDEDKNRSMEKLSGF